MSNLSEKYAFISYSSRESSMAEALKNTLNRHGIRTWMAPNDIPYGSKYAQVINQAIKGCTCFILLLSDNSQNSVWVAKEVERAINYRKPIFPVQIEPLVLNDEFELYISTDQIVRMDKIDENLTETRQLIALVGKMVDAPAVTPAAAKPAPEPAVTAKPEPKQKESATWKVGPNDPCPCGSGKKYKNCHGVNGANSAHIGNAPNDDYTFYMPVEKPFFVTGSGVVFVGRIMKGSIALNRYVTLHFRDGSTLSDQVVQIQMYRKILNYAEAGDNVGLGVKFLTRDKMDDVISITAG